MPELSKLAKLIVHRQEQEKKNERLRIHKNRIENDKLQVQVTYLDWNKVLRSRELTNVEEKYKNKLEKIYDRQIFIEQKRIKDHEKKQSEKETKKINLENSKIIKENIEKERRKQFHGTNQEVTKLFMAKAKSLSNGYRDNDPPKSYYRKKGIVPPDKLITPDISAEAQASFGGGNRTPSSAEHLYKSHPKQNVYGIEVSESLSSLPYRPPSRSISVHSHSALSEASELLMSDYSPLNEDEDDINDAAIDKNFSFNVRPSTAPSQRQSNQGEKRGVLVTEPSYVAGNNEHRLGVEPEIQQIERIERKPKRPATAAASVRFAGNVSEPTDKKRSTIQSSHRRGSLKPPAIMMFRKRASTAGVNNNGTHPVSSTERDGNRPYSSKATLMTNIEQDRIRQKIQKKAECLYSERMKRIVITLMNERGEIIPRRIRGATSPRELPYFEKYVQNVDIVARSNYGNFLKSIKRSNEMKTMLSYIDRCEQGLAIADASQAKTVLLQATNDRNNELNEYVQGFVRK